jgi:outer membrane protein assembly factor BamB
VFFGAGNGKLNRSAPRPAGALLCLDAATGRRLWRYDVPDAVLATPAVGDAFVWFTSRDRHCYCLDRRDGRLRWKRDLGSPVAAAPALCGRHVYAVASGGLVACLDADSGAPVWRFDVGKHARATPELLSTPTLAPTAEGGSAARRLYLAGGLRQALRWSAVVYCLKDSAANE